MKYTTRQKALVITSALLVISTPFAAIYLTPVLRPYTCQFSKPTYYKGTELPPSCVDTNAYTFAFFIFTPPIIASILFIRAAHLSK